MRLLRRQDSKRPILAVAAIALLAGVVAFSSQVAVAQSVYDVVGRNLKKTINSVDRALSDAVGDKPKSKPERGNSRAGQAARAVPPLPVRQPKPWHAATDTAPRDNAGQSAASKKAVVAPTPPAAGLAERNQKPARERLQDKSWPVTVEEARAKARAKADKAAGKPDDIWPELEINIAKARCTHLLKQVNAVVEFEEPFKKGPCGDPAPVRLLSLGSNPSVAVSPPAVVNCSMVFSLHEWLQKDLQPLAQKHLGGKITTIENMSSYSCRNAYARTSTRLSEHARANALDIRGFVTAKGNVAHLLAHWGPTERDIEAYKVAQREAAEKRAAEAKAAAEARAKAVADAKQRANEKAGAKAGAKAVASAKAQGLGERDNAPAPGVRGSIVEGVTIPVPVRSLGYQPDRLGGPKSAPARKTAATRDGVRTKKTQQVPEVDEAKTRTAKAIFLREAHKSACRIFGTVLGPEANNAHRNHFHVDLAPRKRSNFCE